MPISTTEIHPTNHPTSADMRDSCYEFSELAARTHDLMCELNIPLLSWHRLAIIVTAAIEVRNLLFSAALTEPSPAELEAVVEDFLRRALVPGGVVQ